ncbi:O-antigen ligase family protein, partial [Candidatus Parcubacteria bacterium]|nr:O-antigen ligase family protein [Candidatus Parcubacteria bacterium]
AFGLAMTGLFTRLLRRFTPRNDRKILQTTIIIFLSTIFSLILIAGIIKFPLPTPGTGFSASLIQNRAMQISGEAGVSSRWALLPELLKEIKKTPILGAGFGATVSYRTSDPRVLEQNPNGQYTTYAFEWGFLDIWLKLGLLGLSAYLALIIMIFVVAFKRIKKQNISACHSDPPAGGEESRGCRDEILRPPPLARGGVLRMTLLLGAYFLA